MAWVVKKGFVPNPLRKFPKNAPCFCGSGKKAKRCCINLQPELVEERAAEDLRKYRDEKTPEGYK